MMALPDGRLPLSVVIAANHAEAALAACLAALTPQVQPGVAEVIVVEHSARGAAAKLQARFPSVCWVHLDAPVSLAHLRGRGIALAQGEIIAILDAYAVVADNWLEAVRRAHQEHANWVIGGAVDLDKADKASLTAWALYLYEYGLFMPPVACGAAEILPGCNISYKRAALFEGDTPRYPEFWKTFVNWGVEADHSTLWLDPSILVYLNKPIAFGDFLTSRLAHGRCFAAMRTASAGRGKRLARGLSTPLLPWLFLWRWGRVIGRRRRNRSRWLLTLPLQWLLFAAWALGELAGYLRGAGPSCRRLYY